MSDPIFPPGFRRFLFVLRGQKASHILLQFIGLTNMVDICIL